MIDPYVTLAGAVVTRAMADLTRDIRTTDTRGGDAGLKAAMDAADFLLRRLWTDDNLWLGLLGPFLVQRQVRQHVAALTPPKVLAALKTKVWVVGR